MADRMGYKHFLNDRVGRAVVLSRTEIFTNSCHNPPGPGGGRFCSDELGSVGNNVSLSDLEQYHGERIPGLQRMIAEISKVHVMPDLYPKVTVEVWSDIRGGAAGGYEPGSKTIRLAEDSPFNQSSFVHEFGHHITLAEAGEGKTEFLIRVQNDPELRTWHDAVKATPQYAEMARVRAGGPGITAGQRDHAAYLMDARETFARSYAQWIEVKSGSGVLKFQHDKIMDRTKGIYQWEPKQFEPISAAMTAYFQKRGLLR